MEGATDMDSLRDVVKQIWLEMVNDNRIIHDKITQLENKLTSLFPSTPTLQRQDSMTNQSSLIITDQESEGTCYAHAEARLFFRNVLNYASPLNLIPHTIHEKCHKYFNTNKNKHVPFLRDINQTLCPPNATTFILIFWVLYLYFKERKYSRQLIADNIDKVFNGHYLDRFHIPESKLTGSCYIYIDSARKSISRHNLRFVRVNFFSPLDFLDSLPDEKISTNIHLITEICIKIVTHGLYIKLTIESSGHEDEHHIHALVITGYDAGTKRFHLSNSWGGTQEYIPRDNLYSTFKLDGYDYDWKVNIISTILPFKNGDYKLKDDESETVFPIEQMLRDFDKNLKFPEIDTSGGRKRTRCNKQSSRRKPFRKYYTRRTHRKTRRS